MPLEDKILRHTVEREIAKLTQNIDTSLMTTAVINGVVYLGGRIKPWRGTAGRGVDVKRQVAVLQDALGNVRGVVQVVVDATIEERV